MKKMDERMQRLYRAAYSLGKLSSDHDQVGLARLLNLSQQIVHNWENRGPSKDGLLKAQMELGINATWVMESQGPMFISEHASLIDQAKFDVLDAAAECGKGCVNQEHPEVVSSLTMPLEVANRMIGSSNRGDNIKIIVAVNDSMMPTINPGDLLFVDVTVREYGGESIYLLLHGGEMLCKRLSLAGAELMVSSDNRAYPSWQWSDRLESTRILGKVIRALPMDFKRFNAI